VNTLKSKLKISLITLKQAHCSCKASAQKVFSHYSPIHACMSEHKHKKPQRSSLDLNKQHHGLLKTPHKPQTQKPPRPTNNKIVQQGK